MWKEKVKIEGPYNFDRALRRLAFEPLFAVDLEEQSIRVPLWTSHEPTVVHIESTGSVDMPCFVVSGDCRQKDNAMAQIKDIFRWERPLSEIMEFFAATRLHPLFEMYEGTPLVREFSLYRSLMKSIIHQQLNLKFVNTLTERLVTTYGFQKDSIWFYPHPQTVANIPVDDLRRLQFSQRKAEYVIDTSRLIADGDLSLEGLVEASDEEVMQTLVSIRGIGRWTAECFLLFGMGRENLLPAADIGIQNAVKKFYGCTKKPKADALRELGEEWAPYQSYAALYLWESLGSHSVQA